MLPVERNLKLTLAYEGTNYFGWQKTDEGPSIEESLESALATIFQHPIKLQAASRTDRGVHSEGQVVNFITAKENLNLHKLLLSINALLPHDIALLRLEEAPIDFHPTLDVLNKTYSYEICFSAIQLPRHRLFSWHFHYPLNIKLMQQASEHLLGTHDFAAFCNSKKNEEYAHTVRTVQSIRLEETGNERLSLKITGDHFLYKMVRNIVGTLAYVGVGKIQASEIPSILEKKERSIAGVTAPAHGLTLLDISYHC